MNWYMEKDELALTIFGGALILITWVCFFQQI